MKKKIQKDIKWYIVYRYQLILTLYLVFSPFIIYLHLLFSNEDTILTLLGFEIDHGFRSNQYFAWLVISSTSAFVFLCIMFFDLSQNWKYALLFPTCLLFENMLDNFRLIVGINNALLLNMSLSFLSLIALLVFLDLLFFSRHRNKAIEIELKGLVKTAFFNTFLKTYRNIEINTEVGENGNIAKLKTLYNKQVILKRVIKKSGLDISNDFTNRTFWKSLGMIILIVFVCGIWFSHHLIPDGVMSFSFGPININSNGFIDASTFLWYSSRKFVMIFVLVIWFFSIYNWWRYALLSPIILYMYQFWESFQDINSLDAYGNIKVFPLVLVSMLLVLALSRVVRQQSQTLDTYEQISMEIDRLIKKLGKERSGVGDYRNRYQQILDRLVHSKSEEAQLAELTRLQQELQGKII